jgi:hypothetical protein
MKFNDLKFKQLENGVGATHTFDNGITISVQASENHYCYPKENLNSKNDYSSFEVAVFDIDNEFVTKDYIKDADDDVFGWAKRYDIENLMDLILTKIREGNQLEKGLTYAVDNKFITMSQAFEIIRNIK